MARRAFSSWLLAAGRVDVAHGPEPLYAGVAGRCWPWLGYVNHGGYGHSHVPGAGVRLAHRVALVARVGADLAPGVTASHRCGRPSCVRPDHLTAESIRQNTARSPGTRARGVASKLATGRCPAGHDGPWGQNGSCKTCQRGKSRVRHALLAAAARAAGATWPAYAAAHGTSLATSVAALTTAGVNPAYALAARVPADVLEAVAVGDGRAAGLARAALDVLARDGARRAS